MSKPLFVMVDNDNSYITPLEMKFLEDLGDRIDLHVITDIRYYNEFFSSPQKINVLIIDEEMYSDEIHKHEIDNVFILCDKNEDGETIKLNTVKINKYTSIKDIYNRVVNTSSIKPWGDDTERKTEVVLITSAVGGAGKTTLALGIGQALAKEYKRVLYVDAETINTFQCRLGDVASLPASNVASVFTALDSSYEKIKPYIIHGNIDYIPPFATSLVSMGIDETIYRRIVEDAKKTSEYDLILVDTNSAFDLNKAFWLESADRVLIVTETTPQAVYSTNKLLENISIANKGKFFFLFNKCEDSSCPPTNELNVNLESVMCESIEIVDDISGMTIEEIGLMLSIKKATLLVI